MTRKELINIAGTMDCDGRFESFYEFAKNYLLNYGIPEDKKSISFFEIIKNIKNHSSDMMIQNILGKRSGRGGSTGRNNNRRNNSGNAASNDIRHWCDIILGNEEIKKLSADELLYVIGSCARYAKIAKENV